MPFSSFIRLSCMLGLCLICLFVVSASACTSTAFPPVRVMLSTAVQCAPACCRGQGLQQGCQVCWAACEGETPCCTCSEGLTALTVHHQPRGASPGKSAHTSLAYACCLSDLLWSWARTIHHNLRQGFDSDQFHPVLNCMPHNAFSVCAVM